jgi:hypothetical protein
MRKWKDIKAAQSRFIPAANYPRFEKHLIVVTEVGEEEFERERKGRTMVVTEPVFAVTRPGIGPWGWVRINQTNGDFIAQEVGEDFTAAVGRQFMMWSVDYPGMSPGWLFGRAEQQAAKPASSSLPEPPLANTSPKATHRRAPKGNSPATAATGADPNNPLPDDLIGY